LIDFVNFFVKICFAKRIINCTAGFFSFVNLLHGDRASDRHQFMSDRTASPTAPQ
jgi:hypothetical protein